MQLKSGKKNKFSIVGDDEVEKEVEDRRNASAKKQKTGMNEYCTISTHTIFINENVSDRK